MAVNTHIGECAIHIEGGRDIEFRPTFFRVAQLGSPKEILELFEVVQRSNDDGFIAAYRILYTFADENDELDDAIGYFEPTMEGERFKLKYVEGKCPVQDLHVIGCKLLTDALIGRPTKREKEKASDSKKADEFDPAEFVAMGDAHIGGRDWWNRTRIELDKAIKSKYPPKPEDEKPTRAEQENLFAELDRRKALKKEGLRNG